MDTVVKLGLILICGLLILIVLLQKGRGGGLSAAFGGGGGAGSAFGTKTGDVFTWITVVLAGLFMLVSVVGNYAMDKSVAPAPAFVPTESTVPDGQPAADTETGDDVTGGEAGTEAEAGDADPEAPIDDDGGAGQAEPVVPPGGDPGTGEDGGTPSP